MVQRKSTVLYRVPRNPLRIVKTALVRNFLAFDTSKRFWFRNFFIRDMVLNLKKNVYLILWRMFRIPGVVARLTGLGAIRISGRTLSERLSPFVWNFFLRILAGYKKRKPTWVQGNRMFFPISSVEPPVGLVTGLKYAFEEATTSIFKQFLKKGDIVIDIGAHVGYYTLIAARRVGPTGKVYAFEPDPTNYAILQKNIKLNGYHNIIPVRKAIADRTAQMSLFLSNKDSMAHSLYCDSFVDEKSVDIETTTLDEFIPSGEYSSISMIKMDIEGSEPKALEGMQHLAAESRSLKLIVEFLPQRLISAGVTPQEFLNKLAAMGFRIRSVMHEKVPKSEILTFVDIPWLLKKAEGKGGEIVHINLLCER